MSNVISTSTNCDFVYVHGLRWSLLIKATIKATPVVCSPVVCSAHTQATHACIGLHSLHIVNRHMSHMRACAHASAHVYAHTDAHACPVYVFMATGTCVFGGEWQKDELDETLPQTDKKLTTCLYVSLIIRRGYTCNAINSLR